VQIVNMVPQTLSGETWQDSEPSLAVNPANPQQIVGGAFTPDPFGRNVAPIYVSGDGGLSWVLNSIVPSQVGVGMTGDITVAFSDTTNTLYAGILRRPGGPAGETRLNILRRKHHIDPAPMAVLVDRLDADQPYVQVITIPTAAGNKRDRVYVGVNDFDMMGTSTVDRSLNGASGTGSFRSIGIEKSKSFQSLQNGPQVRPACHPDKTVYVAFNRWLSSTGSWEANTLVITADVIVVRDDNGGTGTKPFQALKGAGGAPGRVVAGGIKFPFHRTGQGVPGQQRLGGDLTIAVAPGNSNVVFLGYCDRPASGSYTLHVRASTDRGVTWSSDLLTVGGAINPCLAINSQDQVGLLYQQLTGSGTSLRWVTHFRQSPDGANWSDLVLATTPASAPVLTFSPYLGDYADLMAVGQTFYGIFSASNTPDLANFPNGVTYQRNADFTTRRLLNTAGTAPVAVSIDPFFFKTP